MDKERKERLTNEIFKNKFSSQFELVNYAIKIAANMIKSGRAPRVKIDSQSPALQILAEIAANKDVLEDIEEILPEPEIEKEEEDVKKQMAHFTSKGSERKKNRLAL